MLGLSSFVGEVPENYYELNGTYVCIIGVKKVEVPDVTDFMCSIRALSETEVITQAINARLHLELITSRSIKNYSRMPEKKNNYLDEAKIDLLLPFSLTNQISLL